MDEDIDVYCIDNFLWDVIIHTFPLTKTPFKLSHGSMIPQPLSPV